MSLSDRICLIFLNSLKRKVFALFINSTSKFGILVIKPSVVTETILPLKLCILCKHSPIIDRIKAVVQDANGNAKAKAKAKEKAKAKAKAKVKVKVKFKPFLTALLATNKAYHTLTKLGLAQLS